MPCQENLKEPIKKKKKRTLVNASLKKIIEKKL
jgi:hypothetical protein